MKSAGQDCPDRRFLEQHLRLLLDRLPASIASIDHREIYTHVNQHYAELVNLPAREIIGSHVRDILSPKAYREAKPHIDEVLAGRSVSYEGEFRFREEQSCWLSVHLNPDISADGKVAGFVVMATDISARKEAEATQHKLERQLRQSRKMESIGTLAGGVAHDFNNILQAMMGYSELLADRVRDDEEACHELQEIEKGCERAAMLTRQLLTFSRQQVIRPAHLELSEVISGVLKMLRRLIGEDIELVFESAESLTTIFADRNQMEQVLMNLAINARDAMSGGGRLIVRTEGCQLDTDACLAYEEILPGRYVRLSVSDNGSGMDEETQVRIFDPFFTTKGLGRGTGLGLSTVYGIVRQHEGHIFVNSQLDSGTTFDIFFPAVEAIEETSEVSETAPPPGGTETILLAEDDESVARLASKVLTGAGYSVLVVRDGRTAVEEFFVHLDECSLVILDAVMPVLNGMQAWEEMRKKATDLKALFITGYPVDGMHDRYVLDSKIQVLQKPFSQGDLLRHVRTILDEPSPAPR
jgi:two-component system cell cycle sensor histidine kinase/response regulator CckA